MMGTVMDYTYLMLIIVFIIISIVTTVGAKFFKEHYTLNDGFISIVYGYLSVVLGIITTTFLLGAIGLICIMFYNVLLLTLS